MYICYTKVTTILLYIGIVMYSDNKINSMEELIEVTKTIKAPEACPKELDHAKCSNFILPIRDTIDLINGKWKLPIIGALMFGAKRFKELERQIPKITPRMLSKELRELEVNQMVKRTVYDTIPVSVEYELTKHGRSLKDVMDALHTWGVTHRKKITGK